MVQMKVFFYASNKKEAAELYIPHGSDERDWKEDMIQEAVLLYIPHGSDESYKNYKYFHTLRTLYPTWFR